MKKKRNGSVSGYVGNVLVSGMVAGTLEQQSGLGTSMTATYVNAASKPIGPMMNIKATGMVLKGLSKLKVPKLKGGKKF